MTEKGLAIYCKYPEIYFIIPLTPIYSFKYICGSSFETTHIESISNKKYGIISMDNHDATIALVDGTSIIILDELNSTVPSKQKAGGQSAPRFQRLHDEACHQFYVKIIEHMNTLFEPYFNQIEKIIIGGSGDAKKKLIKVSGIDYRLKKKIDLDLLIDTGYIEGYTAIKEILEKIKNELKECEYIKEQEIISSFKTLFFQDDTKVIYGENETILCLKNNQLKKLLISSYHPHLKEYLELCDQCNTEYYCVSNKSEEGNSFHDIFGGIGGWLRYSITN